MSIKKECEIYTTDDSCLIIHTPTGIRVYAKSLKKAWKKMESKIASEEREERSYNSKKDKINRVRNRHEDF
jgi:protein subunit release factor A